MAEPRQVWAKNGKWGDRIIVTCAQRSGGQSRARFSIQADGPVTVEILSGVAAEPDEPSGDETDGT